MTGAPITPTYNSGYLAHLAALARESAERRQSIPSFKVMIGVALLIHIALLGLAYAMGWHDQPHRARQVHIAFGSRDATPNDTAGAEGSKSQELVDKVDAMLAPPPPTSPSEPKDSENRTATPQQQTRNVSPPVQSEVNDQEPQPRTRQREAEPASRHRSTAATSSSSPRRQNRRNPLRRAGQMTAGSEQSNVRQVKTRYEQMLSGWILNHATSQSLAVPDSAGGRVIVRIRINRNGRILRHHVERSSGFTRLDNAVVKAIGAASPVPSVPADYPGGAELEFLIPINIE